MRATIARARPSKRARKLAAAALSRAEEARHIAWARRHPEKAAAERTLRKGRAQLLERWDHKHEGTAETRDHASRQSQGALARLWKSGAIDADQLAASVQIREAAERIASDVKVRTASLETRIDGGRRGDFEERVAHVRREIAYTRWRAALGGSAVAVIEMIVEDAGVTIVARRRRIGVVRAKRLLVEALNLWWKILGHVRREVDDASLAAA
ncbi:MAG: hypothetical protein QOH47_830 [Sphingomonadales bacterium]|nr:hypothetical protein [Sphingomonadales bacterium]